MNLKYIEIIDSTKYEYTCNREVLVSSDIKGKYTLSCGNGKELNVHLTQSVANG